VQLHANALMHWRIGLSAAIDVKNIKKSMTSLNTTSHLLMFISGCERRTVCAED